MLERYLRQIGHEIGTRFGFRTADMFLQLCLFAVDICRIVVRLAFATVGSFLGHFTFGIENVAAELLSVGMQRIDTKAVDLRATNRKMRAVKKRRLTYLVSMTEPALTKFGPR